MLKSVKTDSLIRLDPMHGSKTVSKIGINLETWFLRGIIEFRLNTSIGFLLKNNVSLRNEINENIINISKVKTKQNFDYYSW